ncbi:MAG: [FeFe] hydrogenase H-cluster maturation GTPase HydF [Spirochaetaceae bacterium]|nr:[FeFe] hydrogenase H-cluster maturation GTPase HydF [Spirochaetaceae bacterium]
MGTPDSLKLQIGIFGAANSGKSSLLNFLTNQEFSIVSEVAGTTADPVRKTMELPGAGPCIFIDTAGFGDGTELGSLREEKTVESLKRSDIAIAVFSADTMADTCWYEKLAKTGKPVIPVLTKYQKSDFNIEEKIQKLTGKEPVPVNTKEQIGKHELLDAIIKAIPKDFNSRMITANLCKEGDCVLLVMPQDIQAPRGRLILPQVQVIRELLDKKCSVMSCTTDMFVQTVSRLKDAPDLIITDSQVVKYVYDNKPQTSQLTTFSILMAANKGDINAFMEGAEAIKNLKSESKVLIAEACTHSPMEEDIGRIKIPRMLKKLVPDITIDFVRGTDFPNKLLDENGNKKYDLIIHCGACMFNRVYMLQRQKEAAAARIPTTNYGVFISAFNNILDKVQIPE